ncbi:MAG: PilW family protein [Proteobacteria bacterium]|nr:PilW family protein [Pseudomonadota bacterium]
MDKRGFSLVELLIVMAVGGILIASLASVFVTQSRTYSIHSDIGETQYTAKAVLDYMAKEIRMLGSGLRDKNYYFKNGRTFNVLSSINSDTGPDAIRIRGNFQGIYGNISSVLGTTIADDDPNRETITVAYKSRDRFSVGNYISIAGPGGNAEIRAINQVAGTNKQNISFRTGDGLNYNHREGTMFNGIQDLRYFVDSTGTLRRNNFENNGNQPILENVEDLQFQYGLDTNGDGYVDQWVNNVSDGTNKVDQVKAIKIWLIVRGNVPDNKFNDRNNYFLGISSTGMVAVAKRYTPPTTLRNYRRVIFTTTVDLRNTYLGS